MHGNGELRHNEDMGTKLIHWAALSTVLLAATACDKEAKRTSAQLQQLSRQAGVEQALNAVSEKYQQTVTPMVNQASDAAEGVETLQNAKEMGSQAADSLRSMGNTVIQKTQIIYRSVPHTERDWVELVDGYNKDFTDWLADNYRDLQKYQPRSSPLSSSHSASPSTRLAGRRRN
jgi:hypothetical protein